ncbi:benzoyl-CoA 2,3-epoxidase subunit BoxA [Piscinibacter koreensis]|uniref:Benzoyl-CoA oxygenase component A n=1 Tax=Piscinibacter koreensis TaxID=2742824 RepID=A0A7Y6NKG2_9BURK|nr:benzoyl-CoA 2,3-epoxidase subunit BoxA [Schlegelella koreensis]NUZ04736.1 benzoyl-CoA 2,3-epoxidase subunit BoxA [Schlegelella koreensis]
MDIAATPAGLLKQHLIDPEICIRCNTCEATCPVGAVTHDDRNYVVDATKCNFCMDCISPCPTGSIDNWRLVPQVRAYSVEEQLVWDELPAELSPEQLEVEGVPHDTALAVEPEPVLAVDPDAAAGEAPFNSAAWGSTLPPWSAARAYVNVWGPKNPITATVTGNFNCTEAGFASETHHVVLDFGNMPFPVLEGQSIGIVPPGVDARGKPHVARQYSIASPRNGERPGYNNVSLTVKRVTEDHQGRPTAGVCSNYVCDLKVGDTVQVIGPFGSSFLMPNHPHSNIVMICTGTGSAPMRAMTEWRRRLRKSGKFASGKLMLFFGARSPQELPYFGPLQNLPKDFIDINLAFSRVPGQPRRYVQDLMRERAVDLAALLKDANTYIYVCGLKSMEEGVVLALRDVAEEAGIGWDGLGPALKAEGRLHLETY